MSAIGVGGLIYAGVITGLNIFTIIERFTQIQALRILDDVKFQIFCFATVYWAYMFIVMCKDVMCKSPNLDRFYSWAHNTAFKFIFCFQGYSAYSYLSDKFFTLWRMGKFLPEFSLMYYTLILYVLMALSIFFYWYKLNVTNFLKDIMVISIITAIAYIVCGITKVIDGNGKSTDWGILSPLLGIYLVVFVMAFNSFQFYNFIVSRKTGDIEPTAYTAI